MQRKSLFTGGLIAATAVLVLTGCQQQPQKAPEQVIREGLTNLASVKSYQFDVSASGNMSGSQATTGAPVKSTFTVGLGGSVDFKDMKNPKVAFKFDGSGTSNDKNGSASAELRMNNSVLYLIISKLESPDKSVIPPEMVSQFVGKWWLYKVPTELMTQFETNLPVGGTQEQLTPEQQKMKNLFDNTKFFKNVKFVGVEDVKGEQSYHYTVDFDKDAFMAYASSVADAQNKPMTADDTKQLQDAMKKVDISGSVWVGTTSNILNQTSADIKLTGTAPSDPTGTITLKGSAWSFDKPVTVEEPTGAEDIEPILNSLLGGGIPGGALPTDGSLPTSDGYLPIGGSEQLNYDQGSVGTVTAPPVGYGSVSDSGVSQ